MYYTVIKDLLSQQQLQEIQQLASQGPFVDGKHSAGGLAKAAKNNLQLSSNANTVALDQISAAFYTHPAVVNFAQPSITTKPILNCYKEGMSYHNHVDAAYIHNVRTDISFTLFLDDPSTYEGGELVVTAPTATFKFKLPAGHIVFYQTGYSHEVLPVTRGTRNAVVGWIQSHIRDADKRSLVTRLRNINGGLKSASESSVDLQRYHLNTCIEDLIRIWGE